MRSIDGSCSGMVAHFKPEYWLSFTGQVAQNGPDYSQNIFDSHEFDYDEFKEAFRLVFYENNYKEHYNKMMKS